MDNLGGGGCFGCAAVPVGPPPEREPRVVDERRRLLNLPRWRLLLDGRGNAVNYNEDSDMDEDERAYEREQALKKRNAQDALGDPDVELAGGDVVLRRALLEHAERRDHRLRHHRHQLGRNRKGLDCSHNIVLIFRR